MALTITEALYVNTLLGYLLGTESPSGRRYTGPEAEAAASFLALKAHQALSAGLDNSQVHQLWQESPPQPAKKRKAKRP